MITLASPGGDLAVADALGDLDVRESDHKGCGHAPGSPLGWSFAMVYAMAAVFAAISFLVALRMPNTPLRETLHAVPSSGIKTSQRFA
jgi:hypothetical protein